MQKIKLIKLKPVLGHFTSSGQEMIQAHSTARTATQLMCALYDETYHRLLRHNSQWHDIWDTSLWKGDQERAANVKKTNCCQYLARIYLVWLHRHRKRETMI